MATNFITTEWVTYEVGGDTLEAVVNSISHLPEAGSCEWFPQWTASWDEHGKITEASVDVHTRITLPAWSAEMSAPDSERNEWKRFLAALQHHEQSHYAIVERCLSNLDEQMIGHSQHSAQQIFNEALNELQRGSDDFDSETDHGRNAGTTIEY
jgi:predicted secreted Zn-dependent protease